MSEFKNVLVVGASGNVGQHVLPALIATKAFNITVLTRSSSSAKKRFPDDTVQVVTADYGDKSALVKIFKGQDAILFLVGATGWKSQELFIDAAIEAGVKRFIPSEFGSDVENEYVIKTGIMQDKLVVRNYLREKAEKGLIEYTFFQTGAFFDFGMRMGLYKFDLKNHSVTIMDSGDKQLLVTTLPTVGKITAASLLPAHTAASKNALLTTESYKTSQKEILSILEKVTGEKWKMEHSTSKQLEAQGAQELKDGNPMAFITIIMAIVYDPDYKYDTKNQKSNTEGWVEEDESMEELLTRLVNEKSE